MSDGQRGMEYVLMMEDEIEDLYRKLSLSEQENEAIHVDTSLLENAITRERNV